MLMLVTLSCLLKMSGISSTPTWSDFRLDKRRSAELGIVGDGKLVGSHAAGEDAEA